VVAYETYGNPYGLQDSSVSNIAVCNQQSKIYIPNAFTPEGYNQVFKPFNVFVDFEEYQLIIYNRWGQEVFRSDNPNEGWGGQYKGSPAKAGVYAYYLTYSVKSGQTRQRKGTVMLIR
jgi:gliding motility-associated-like protein